MSKTGKILSIVGGTLATLLIAVLLVPPLIDAAAVRGQIERMVSSSTGLELRLAHDPRLRLLPRPRLSASDITLQGTAARFSDLRLEARGLTLDLALLPLLIGRVQPAELIVDGLAVRTPTGPPGVGEWRLGAERIRLVPGAGPPPRPDSTTPPTLDRIEVHDGWAERNDPHGAAPLRISGLDLLGGPVAPDQPGPVSGHGHVDMPGVVAGAIALEGMLGPGPVPLVLTSDRLQIGPLRDISARLETQLVPVSDGVDATDLRLTADDLRIDGELRLRNPWTLERQPALAGRLSLTELDLRTWLAGHGLTSLPGSPATLRRVALTTDLRLDPPRPRPDGVLMASFRLDQTRIDLDQTRADASLQLQSGSAEQRLDFEVRADRLMLDPWLAALQQPDSASPSATTPPSAASTAMDAPPSLAPLHQAAEPALPPPADGGVSADTRLQSSTLAPPSASAPTRPLVHTLIEGRLTVGRLGLAGLWADGVSAEIVGRDRQLDLDLAAARVLGGTLAGNLRLDGSVLSEPDFALTAAANGVQLEPLLQVRFGSAPVSGTADISADLSGKGGDAKTVRESLSGSVSFLARDGRIRGIGIVGVIIRAAGGSDQDGEDMTVFSQLSGTAKGKHGRFRSDDIQGESPLLAVTGRGELDLPAERMDLKLTSILRESASGARIAELEGLPIPVRITGDWRRPEVKVDLGPVLREAGRRALGRGLDRRSDQLEDLERRIGIPGLEEGLRGLLGL